MSSIKTRFEGARRILTGLEKGNLDDVQKNLIEPIEYILNTSRGKTVTARCCNDIYTGTDGRKWIRCDTYNLPRGEFAKQCEQCAREIESGLPELKNLLKYNASLQ